MSEILIHGASSFLGKHFVKKLNELHKQVTIIARENSNLEFCKEYKSIKIFQYKDNIEEILINKSFNVSNPVLYEFSWHGVYGEQRNNPEQITINIPLIISSLKFAKEINAKHWIGIGSQAEYGNLDKKISEDDNCKPTTLYGKSKLITSQISETFCKEFRIEHTWLRLFSVFGPEDNHNWLIPYLIKDMLKNKPINATKGEQRWDYLYIDDVTDVLYKLISSTGTIDGLGIVNLGSGKSVQIKLLIKIIKQLTNSTSEIHLGAIQYRDDQVMFMEADIKKLSGSLDWKPKINIEEGLLRTIKYFSGKNLSV